MRDWASEGIVAVSNPMTKILGFVEKISGTNENVLISGETGTGKTTLAQIIHRLSKRGQAQVFFIDNGALTPSIFEDELWGHVKGAFTGATSTEEGLIEKANRSTLVFDGIDNFPLDIQRRLLFTIEKKKTRKIGAHQSTPIDIRFISIIRNNLEESLSAGRFLKDLYYRLNTIEIFLPSLRERRDDILPLAQHFLQTYSKEQGKNLLGFDALALQILRDYDYPGNIWELENAIKQVCIIESGSHVSLSSIPGRFMPPAKTSSSIPQQTHIFSVDVDQENFSLDKELENIERTMIINAIEKARYDSQKAANLLNVTHRSFRYRCDKLKIDYARWGRAEPVEKSGDEESPPDHEGQPSIFDLAQEAEDKE